MASTPAGLSGHEGGGGNRQPTLTFTSETGSAPRVSSGQVDGLEAVKCLWGGRILVENGELVGPRHREDVLSLGVVGTIEAIDLDEAAFFERCGAHQFPEDS